MNITVIRLIANLQRKKLIEVTFEPNPLLWDVTAHSEAESRQRAALGGDGSGFQRQEQKQGGQEGSHLPGSWQVLPLWSDSTSLGNNQCSKSHWPHWVGYEFLSLENYIAWKSSECQFAEIWLVWGAARISSPWFYSPMDSGQCSFRLGRGPGRALQKDGGSSRLHVVSTLPRSNNCAAATQPQVLGSPLHLDRCGWGACKWHLLRMEMDLFPGSKFWLSIYCLDSDEDHDKWTNSDISIRQVVKGPC